MAGMSDISIIKHFLGMILEKNGAFRLQQGIANVMYKKEGIKFD